MSAGDPVRPETPPLIGIEEPELGLHPDILPKVADLLMAASERTQLIVTTHSEILVDAFTDRPARSSCAKSPRGKRRCGGPTRTPWPMVGEIPPRPAVDGRPILGNPLVSTIYREEGDDATRPKIRCREGFRKLRRVVRRQSGPSCCDSEETQAKYARFGSWYNDNEAEEEFGERPCSAFG